MRSRIEIVKGDITKLEIDAIVNAANTSLLGGGGVDGAIHRVAGPGLVQECRTLNGCPTGGARLTGGHGLPAKHVIHTVGPIWRDGRNGESELLAKAYRSCFTVAAQQNFKSVAFPSISTGAYRFPLEPACRIALTESQRHLAENPQMLRLLFVAFDDDTYSTYLKTMESIFE